jgi:hypothetical protein
MSKRLLAVSGIGVLGLMGVLVALSVPETAEAWFPPLPMWGDTIAGIVYDSDGDPVPGIEVALEGPVSDTTTTDSGGNFEFTDLFPGGYTVSVCDGADSKEVSLGCCDIFIWLTASCAD